MTEEELARAEWEEAHREFTEAEREYNEAQSELTAIATRIKNADEATALAHRKLVEAKDKWNKSIKKRAGKDGTVP